MANDVLVRFTL